MQDIYVPKWSVTRGFELNDGRSCADMIDHFTPPTFFKTVKDKEIKRLGSQLSRAKDESEEVARLRARVSSLEAIESSLRGEVASAKEHSSLLEQERNALNLKATSLESTVAEKDRELSDLETSSSSLRVQNQNLVNQVHELEVSSAGLREKLETYEGSVKQLEEFQDKLMEPLKARLAEIDCLNSTKYMEALGNAFGHAIEKGMHKGFAPGIEHGQAGRCLSDLEAYNPSAKADFNFVVRDLRGLDFPLLQELSAKKDASTWDVMDLLCLAEIDADFTRCCMHFQENFHPHLLNAIAGRRWLLTHGMKLLMAKCLNSTEYMEALGNAFGHAIEKGMQEGLAARIEHGQAGRCLSDLEAYNPSAEADFNSAMRDLRDDAVAEVLGMIDLQPNVGQLMVPVDHKRDKVVIGSQALSVALETCHRRVRKMERNLVERLPLLRDIFVSIDHPVSTEALSILLETSTEPLVTTLVTMALSTMVIHPNPNPFLLVEDYENLDLTGVIPADVIPESKGEGNVEGTPTGDAGDVFSHLENEARDVVL
ncbi:hypothetical protein Tco_0685071 [Tanacetum coccineum]